MSTPTLYGIKNCDTIKKALKWLEKNHISYTFHDYKKNGLDIAIFKQAVNEHGWETVINKRGTTWRALSEEQKNTMNDTIALECSIDNPSIVTRPILLFNGKTYIGFKDAFYEETFRKDAA